MALDELVGGRVERDSEGSPFLLVEKTMDQMNAKKLTDYVEAYTKHLLLHGLGSKFGDLRGIHRDRMLFFDIESCGFGTHQPIISIGINEFFNGEFKVKCAVARDFTEGRAVIDYFIKRLEEFEAHFSFNGDAFDTPRILRRAVLSGAIQRKEYMEINHRLHSRHHDLYPLLKKKTNMSDCSLQTFERYILEYVREEDIPSRFIPGAYRKYVFGDPNPDIEAKNERRMAKIILHNMIDAVSTSAILPYICQ